MKELRFNTGWRVTALVALVTALAMPFAIYAMSRGIDVTDPQEQLVSRFWSQDARFSTALIYGHMVSGAAITVLAPLQMMGALWHGIPKAHRVMGYIVSVLALVTGICGLAYIGMRGTIGGTVMNAGFGLYGILMILCAIRTVQVARQRHPKHRLWAQRLVILALASWLYRVHYGVWELATGGVATRPDFTGLFDMVQVFAFYLPYLALHHWWWTRSERRRMTS